jgi:hypothetical protein
MAYTQSNVDALKKAIATGVRKVRYESNGEVRETQYRSIAEMKAVLADMEAEVGSGRSLADLRVVTGYRGNLS